MSSIIRRIERKIMKDRKVEKTRLLQPAVKNDDGIVVKEAVYGYPLVIPKVETGAQPEG